MLKLLSSGIHVANEQLSAHEFDEATEKLTKSCDNTLFLALQVNWEDVAALQ